MQNLPIPIYKPDALSAAYMGYTVKQWRDMNHIDKEYPEGLRRSELVLVRMMRESRSWSDYMEITDALWNLRCHAESMRKEHEHLTADSGDACQQAMPLPNA